MKKEKCAIRCVGAPAAGAYEGAHFPFQESPPLSSRKRRGVPTGPGSHRRRYTQIFILRLLRLCRARFLDNFSNRIVCMYNSKILGGGAGRSRISHFPHYF